MDSETAATELSPDVSFVSMSKQSSDFEKKVLLEFDGLKRRFDDLSRMLFSLQAGIATSVDHLGRPSASVGAIQTRIDANDSDVRRLGDENARLSRHCTELANKLSALQTKMARAGRREDILPDGVMANDFSRLKSEIFQFVRTHFNSTDNAPPVCPGSSPNIKDLFIQSKVAEALHQEFFPPNALLFGYQDDHLPSLFGYIEMTLRDLRSDEEEVKNWRVSTVRMVQKLPLDEAKRLHIRDTADRIWREYLKEYHSCARTKGTSSRAAENARIADLEGLCGTAYDLAIKFRASKVDYEWEQGQQFSAFSPHEEKGVVVVGNQGVDPGEDKPSRVAFVVFGGVVRGDKTTGLLQHGRTRVLATDVVRACDGCGESFLKCKMNGGEPCRIQMD